MITVALNACFGFFCDKAFRFILRNLRFGCVDRQFRDFTVQLFATESLIDPDDISLENKLIVSIAARLQAEKYLKQVIIAHEGHCPDSESNQMRAWYEKAKPYLSSEEKAIFDEINLITPEAIHLNAFMYEPLIDVSIWALTDLYSKTVHLGQAVTNNGNN